MSDTIYKIVQNIKDSQKARIKLTTSENKQHTLDCVYKEGESPHFFLIFPPNTIPPHIHYGKIHPLSLLYKKSSITIGAKVNGTKGDRTLELTAQETIDPASMREYFRVNIVTPIEARYEVKNPLNKQKNWSLVGTTQDLSGSGALALFPDEPLNVNHIFLTIRLPDSSNSVRAVAHVVRKRKLRRERWQVAFHFDVISDKHIDQLIKCCLSEQRKHLREKVRII